MIMTDDKASLIAACANIAEEAIRELTAILNSPQSHRTQYDRQTPIRLKFAIRWCTKIRDNIRQLDPNVQSTASTESEKLDQRVLHLLGRLRPVIAASRDSAWRTSTLHDIDLLLNDKQQAAPEQEEE